MSRSPTKATKSSPATPGTSSSRDGHQHQDATLNQLDYLDSYFASFASRVESIDRSIDMKKPSTLMTAKHDLAQIIGDLESLQANEVCAFLFLLYPES
jgi:SUMO ligase MMS21 Smc5/6 complex component